MRRVPPPVESGAVTVQELEIETGTVAVDCSLGLFCTLTVTGNCTISNPTNANAGDELTIVHTQNGTGGYWVDYGSAFEKPAVFTLANAVTTHRWVYDGTVWRLVSEGLIRRRLGSDTTDTTGSLVNVTGGAFVPAPGGLYKIEVLALAITASSGTGAQFAANPGNIQGGSVWSGGRNSVSSILVIIDVLTASADSGVLNALSGTTASSTPALLVYTIKAHASAPTAFQLRAKTETPSTQITVQADTVISIERVA